jgi:hypothetical protein
VPNTSREKVTADAFWCAGDPHVSSNVLSLANLLCAPEIKNIPSEFTLCAGDNKKSGSPGIKKFKKSKNFKKTLKF